MFFQKTTSVINVLFSVTYWQIKLHRAVSLVFLKIITAREMDGTGHRQKTLFIYPAQSLDFKLSSFLPCIQWSALGMAIPPSQSMHPLDCSGRKAAQVEGQGERPLLKSLRRLAGDKQVSSLLHGTQCLHLHSPFTVLYHFRVVLIAITWVMWLHL